MDVAMSISSTIQEIHDRNPEISKKELFKSGIHVGKDMMGTMSNTLILAFTGSSLNTMIMIYAYSYPYNQMINMYSIGIEPVSYTHLDVYKRQDFINGALGTKEAEAIVPFVKDKIKEYREAGNPVFFTRDTHGEDYLDTQEGKNLPVKHCIEGTFGWQISDEIGCSEDDMVFDKNTFG